MMASEDPTPHVPESSVPSDQDESAVQKVTSPASANELVDVPGSVTVESHLIGEKSEGHVEVPDPVSLLLFGASYVRH